MNQEKIMYTFKNKQTNKIYCKVDSFINICKNLNYGPTSDWEYIKSQVYIPIEIGQEWEQDVKVDEADPCNLSLRITKIEGQFAEFETPTGRIDYLQPERINYYFKLKNKTKIIRSQYLDSGEMIVKF